MSKNQKPLVSIKLGDKSKVVDFGFLPASWVDKEVTFVDTPFDGNKLTVQNEEVEVVNINVGGEDSYVVNQNTIAKMVDKSPEVFEVKDGRVFIKEGKMLTSKKKNSFIVSKA